MESADSEALDMRAITDVNLFKAVELGWLHRVRELLEAPNGRALMDATSTSENGTPLHFACLHGQVEILQYFVRCVAAALLNPPLTSRGSLGYSVNLMCVGGMATYPIHWAASRSNTRMLKYLLDNGANVNCKDAMLNTPLIKSAQTEHIENALLLLSRGADVTAVDQHGDGPFQWACNRANGSMARMLLAAGADPHALDAYKQSALHHAVISGSLPLVRTLVALGVSTTARDSNNNTPVDIAIKRGASHKSIALFLLQAASPNQWSTRWFLWSPSLHERLMFFVFLALAAVFNVAIWALSPRDGGVLLFAPMYLAQLVMWVLFFTLRNSNPGVLPQSSAGHDAYRHFMTQFGLKDDWAPNEDADLALRLCHTCCHVKPERMSHCSECNVCVADRDSHIGFFQNCVGQQNRVLFVAFLVSLLVAQWLAVGALQTGYQAHRSSPPHFWAGVVTHLALLSVAFVTLGRLLFALKLMAQGHTWREETKGPVGYLRHRATNKWTNPYAGSVLHNIAWFFRMTPPPPRMTALPFALSNK